MYIWTDGTDMLVHHGIKGQKWGVRRWQDKSGSLINDGYEHYYGHARPKRTGMTNKEKKDSIRNALKDSDTKYERYLSAYKKHEDDVNKEIDKRVQRETGFKTLNALGDAAAKEDPSIPYKKSLWYLYNGYDDDAYNLRQKQSEELKKAEEAYNKVAKDFVENWVNQNGSLRYDESILNYSPKTYNHEHQKWYSDISSLVDSYISNKDYTWAHLKEPDVYAIVRRDAINDDYDWIDN